jgi:hypothetical protein
MTCTCYLNCNSIKMPCYDMLGCAVLQYLSFDWNGSKGKQISANLHFSDWFWYQIAFNSYYSVRLHSNNLSVVYMSKSWLLWLKTCILMSCNIGVWFNVLLDILLKLDWCIMYWKVGYRHLLAIANSWINNYSKRYCRSCCEQLTNRFSYLNYSLCMTERWLVYSLIQII